MPQLANNNQVNPTVAPNAVDLLRTLLGQGSIDQLNKAGIKNYDPMQEKGTFGPYQEGVAKALKDSGLKHGTEAIQQGVPPEHIERQAGLSKQQDPVAILASLLTMAGQNQQQPQQPVQPDMTGQPMNYQNQGQQMQQFAPQIIPPRGPFTKQQIDPKTGNVQLGGFLDFRGTPIDQLVKAQQLTGRQPIQPNDQLTQDAAMQRQLATQKNDFFKNIMDASTKQPSPSEALLLGNINSGISQIDALSQQLQQDPNIFKKWTSPGDPTRQSIVAMNEDVIDILGRLRSQGAISGDEEKRFKGQLPKIGIGASFENPKVAKFKLDKLRNLFADIKQTATPRTNEFAQRINQLRQMGATDDQIYNAYRSGGM